MIKTERVAELLNDIGRSLDAPAQAAYVLAENRKEILGIVKDLEIKLSLIGEMTSQVQSKPRYPMVSADLNETVDKLLQAFPGGHVSVSGQFIAYKNQYGFSLSTCESLLDVKCKTLEWLSRNACDSEIYREGINTFLGTNFSADEMEKIYTYLGNGINHNKTIAFIVSGYDFSILGKSIENESIESEEMEELE